MAYELERLIGRGGTSEVWLAVGPGGARVAIKRLRSHQATDEAARRRFRTEAELASLLVHPHIVRVLDAAAADGLVMELVEGMDAATACRLARERAQPMPTALASHVVACVARALAYAHGLWDADGRHLGLVHRDVNPPNVLLSFRGDVKLADFGTARVADRRDLTTTGVVRGKACYFAPEQLLGLEPSSATDVYALGATLHALAAGRPPLEHWDDVARRMAGGPLPVEDSLDPRLMAIVIAAMDVTAANRPSASELAEWLAAVAAEGVESPPAELARWMQSISAAARGTHDSLFELPDDTPDRE